MSAQTTDNDKSFLQLLSALAADGFIDIHNARGGFACNSSSSHSIVVLPDASNKPKDRNTDYDYGDFVLTESADKIRYLASMTNSYSQRERDAIAELRDQYGVEHDLHSRVDHDSLPTVPTDFYSEGLSGEFLRDLGRLLAHPQVAVIGGSNGDVTADLGVQDQVKVFWPSYHNWRSRKDTVDGKSWWVLFNTSDGTKLRISLNVDDILATAVKDEYDTFNRAMGQYTPTKAQAPELVDIKLTNRCAYEADCGFCYMGSVTDGDEGDLGKITRLISSYANQQVFEIAFGGGEPTLWPHFEEVLAFTRSVGIVPNFTTKNYTWVTKPYAEKWFDLIGSVAFSVNSLSAFDRLVKNMNKANAAGVKVHPSKISVQMIPDLVPKGELEEILTRCSNNYWRVTLLGYKTVGRGADYTPSFVREPSVWMDIVSAVEKNSQLRRGVAIDTALAVQSKAELDKRGVPSWMYHLEEGTFSMYVDAVTGRMGPSSYIDARELTEVNLDASIVDISQHIAQGFASYTGEFSSKEN